MDEIADTQESNVESERRPLKWLGRKLRQLGWARVTLLAIGLLAIAGWGISLWQRADTLPMTGIAEFAPVASFEKLLDDNEIHVEAHRVADFDQHGPRDQWRSVRCEVQAWEPNGFDTLLETWRERLREEAGDHWQITSGDETDRAARPAVAVAFLLTGSSVLTNCHIQVRIEKPDARRYVISYYAHEYPK